jgi:alpha-beta hydrolase superfamily lysophospholipase
MKKWRGDIVFLLIVGALISGWMYLYPRPVDSPFSPLSATEDLYAQDLPVYASLEGLKLTYRLYEPAGEVKYVLILMHDTLLHGGWYATLGRDLAQEGVAVYLPDRRGWGRSAGDHRQVEEDKSVLAEDIAALISAARYRYPQTDVYLGAHGRGAGLVLRYVASRRPVAGAVLISPYISEDQPNLNPQGWQVFASAHPGEAFLARSGLVYWHVWHYNWPPSMAEADPLLESDFPIAWMQETVPDDVAAAYQAMTVPLLVVQGQDDPLFDPDKTAGWMTRFATTDRQLETLPGADYLSAIDAAAPAIARWLAGR